MVKPLGKMDGKWMSALTVSFQKKVFLYYPCGENIMVQRDGGTKVVLKMAHHMLLADLTWLLQEFVSCFLQSCSNGFIFAVQKYVCFWQILQVSQKDLHKVQRHKD